MARFPEPGGRWALRPHVPRSGASSAMGRQLAGDRLAGAGGFGFAVALGGLVLAYLWPSHGELLDAPDLASGTVACTALWWRRAHPVAVTLAAAGAAAFSPLALGAGLVAVCAAAGHTRGRALLVVAVAAAVASVAFPLANPTAGEVLKIGFPAFLLTVIAFGWGLYLGTRRELVASLRERAARLEADQQRSTAMAREPSAGASPGRCTTCWPTGCRC